MFLTLLDCIEVWTKKHVIIQVYLISYCGKLNIFMFQNITFDFAIRPDLVSLIE